MSDLMERWETLSFGVSNLKKVTRSRPAPGYGEILIRVEAVSLNYRDTEVLESRMYLEPEFPFTPASDLAGTVIETGEGVTRFAVGDQAVSMCITNWVDGEALDWSVAPPLGGTIPGILAQYVVLPADWCVQAPKSLTAIEASTLPIAALTAWMAVCELAPSRSDQTVLIQGTGGVSLFAAQFGLAAGANVIVTTSSDQKAEQLRKLGVRTDNIIDRSITPDWPAAVMDLTDGRGADNIVEVVGGENIRKSLDAVRQGGRIALIGFMESYDMSMSILPILGKRVTIEGISVGPRRAMEDMIRAIDRHKIKPVIDRVYNFDDVPAAFQHLNSGPFGKVVIKVAS